MRLLADQTRIRAFLNALGQKAKKEAQVYLVGGSTAVLHGWRSTTIDIDLWIVPDIDEMLRELPGLKESLKINVELVTPSHFVPELPGWKDRSLFIERIGKASFYHYDLYSQALAKIERGHEQDLKDVSEMFTRNVIEPKKLKQLFEQTVSFLYKYPAIDPTAYRRAVERAVAEATP